jgi:hypothetical protein
MISVISHLASVLLNIFPRAFTITWAVLFGGIPIAALSTSWVQFFRNRELRGRSLVLIAKVSLLILTASYMLFLCGSWVWVWGPYYSNRRYITIGINLALSLLVLVIARLKENPLRAWLILSAVVMLLLWLFAGAINSVV